jgi:hypothetical protein
MFIVAFCEAFPVGLYRIDGRLIGVQHKEGSVSGVVVVETTFNLFKNDVFVRFDNVKLIVVFAVVSYRKFLLNLGECYYVGDCAITVPHFPIVL